MIHDTRGRLNFKKLLHHQVWSRKYVILEDKTGESHHNTVWGDFAIFSSPHLKMKMRKKRKQLLLLWYGFLQSIYGPWPSGGGIQPSVFCFLCLSRVPPCKLWWQYRTCELCVCVYGRTMTRSGVTISITDCKQSTLQLSRVEYTTKVFCRIRKKKRKKLGGRDNGRQCKRKV